MKTVKAKIKGTSAILEGCICDDSFFVSVDHDTFERYDLDEIELCEPNLNSLTLEEAAMNYIAPIENEDGLKVINFSGQDIKDAFIAGSEWRYQKDRAEFAKLKAKEWMSGYDEGLSKGKEQMMKDAVEEPFLPGSEEDKDMVVGHDYVPVDWVETLDLYGRWKIIPMKDAVEGYVTLTMTGIPTVAATIKEGDNIGVGDKVRIIILPKEDKQ